MQELLRLSLSRRTDTGCIILPAMYGNGAPTGLAEAFMIEADGQIRKAL